MGHIIGLAPSSQGTLSGVQCGEVDLLLLRGKAEQHHSSLAGTPLGFKEVQEQLGRLSAGQGAVGGGNAGGLQQTAGLCLGHIALRPHAAHVFVLIAQSPHEDRHRLSGGHRLVGLELPVGKSGDDALFRRHVDVGGRPEGGLHIREDGNGGIPSQFLAAVHGVDRHFAELGAGQRRVGPERAVAVAVQHTHEPQGLNGGCRVVVRHVGEPGGIGRPGRHCQQGRQHTDCQQPCQNSFFHKSLSFTPPAGLPQAAIWMPWPPGSCRTARPAPQKARRPPASPR